MALSAVPRVDVGELSAWEFKQKYMLPNMPILITGLSKTWKACKEWVAEDGSPNFDCLEEKFGNLNVPVTDCSQRNRKLTMKMSEYVKYWKQKIQLEKLQEPSSNASTNTKMECLYLKDWCFNLTQPDYQAYEHPSHFEDDWLNAHWKHQREGKLQEDDMGGDDEEDSCETDHRFVYMGPRGSWTPLHADVLRSFSWSTNVTGTKHWLLFPTEQTDLLRDVDGELSLLDASPGVPDSGKYPRVHEAQPLQVLQGPGEALFVPSGWFHQVRNMEDTISINHNWLNGANARWGWDMLQTTLSEVVAGLFDPEDREDEVLLMDLVSRKTGMDMNEYARMVQSGAQHDLDRFLKSGQLEESTAPGVSKETIVRAEVMLDMLKRTRDLMEKMAETWPSLEWDENLSGWSDLLKSIVNTLKSNSISEGPAVKKPKT